ncbi:O-antigen polymerase [Neobacillus rhizosphaerae]|uniref:O-antigen polymerase n=1 Tax=Neobacillus rhizosphaerae TaxID=2880965 RepID=UPI003D2801F7
MYRFKVNKILLFLVITVFGIYSIQLITGFSEGTENFIFRIIVGIIFVYCIYRGVHDSKLINPYLLFSITPFSLLMYSDKISPTYLVKLNTDTWVLAIINMIAFLIALSLTKGRKVIDSSNINLEAMAKSKRYVLTKHCILFFIIGHIPTVYSTVFGGTMPYASTLSLFSFFAIVCAFRTKNRLLITGVLFLTLLSFTGGFNKTAFLFLGMTIVISLEKYYFQNNKSKLRLIGIITVTAILGIFVAFPLKDYMSTGGSLFSFFNDRNNTGMQYYEGKINWTEHPSLMLPYMYLVSSWTNVQYVMLTQDTSTFGLWLLKPLLGYFSMDKFFDSYYSLFSYSSFNTFTFVSVVYKDFGFYGSIFGTMFLGWFVKKVYLRYINTNSSLDTAVYALTACAVLQMFFSNHFLMLSYPFTIFILSWIYKKIIPLSERKDL